MKQFYKNIEMTALRTENMSRVDKNLVCLSYSSLDVVKHTMSFDGKGGENDASFGSQALLVLLW